MSDAYNLHQKLRTIVIRKLKKKDYDGAITSLYDGAHQLLTLKEQGSGCDLACYLADVYQTAKTPSTVESRKRLIDLITLAGNDFWRKKLIDASVKWSVGVTGTPGGDGHLRLAIGEILSKEGHFYASESHFIVACSPPPGLSNSADLFPAHAPKAYACMMLEWLEAYAKDAVAEYGKGDAATIERLSSGTFALRGLLPLLMARALTASRGFLSIYTSRLVQRHANILLPVQPNPKPYTPPPGMAKPPGDAQQLYLTANAELNFAQMTLAMAATAVEHKKKTQGSRVPDGLRDTWIAAVRQFQKEASATGDEDDEDDYYEQVLPELSRIYFDIQPPRNANPNFMQDMLGSLMGGGGGSGTQGGDGRSGGAQTVVVRAAPPPAVPKRALESAGSEQSGEQQNDGEGLDLD